MKSRPLLVIVSLLGACTLAGQTASMKGPVSGPIYDPSSRSIRPVMGFPGSSYLGKATLKDVEMASIAPDGETALVTEAGQTVLIRGLRSPDPDRLPVPDLVADPDYVTWALNAGAAVVYSSVSRQLQRIELLPSGLIVEPAVDLSHLEGEVTCLVTNADAKRTVLGLRHPTLGGLYAVSGGAPAVRLKALPNPGAAVFGNASNILYAIDRDTRQVLRFEDIASGGWDWLSFSGENEPLADPVGIALNGQRLYVAGGLDRTIREYDLDSRTVLSELSLDVPPRYLMPVAATTSVFVLGPPAKPGHPIWILSTRPVPSLSFVPSGE